MELRKKLRDYNPTAKETPSPELSEYQQELFELESENPNNVIWRKLTATLPKYLTSLDFNYPDLFLDLNGFQTYKLNHTISLSLRLTIQKVKNNISELKYCAILYNNHMLYYDLPIDVMQLLYNEYLIKTDSLDLKGFQSAKKDAEGV